MDYNDHIDNSDEDHSYDVENDEYDDEKLYDLVVAWYHVAVTYYMKYIDKQPCKDSEQTSYMWLMDCLMGNETKCLEWSRMFSFNCVIFYNIHMGFSTQGILSLKSQ